MIGRSCDALRVGCSAKNTPTSPSISKINVLRRLAAPVAPIVPTSTLRPIPASALDLPQSLTHELQWQAQRVIAETV